MDKLVEILADMVRSALVWEQEHGLPPHENRKIEPPKSLTIVDVPDTLNASQNIDRGENNDH